MWVNFTLKWNGMVWQCEAKVYDTPSMFGIRNGRVSKLSALSDNDTEYQYDRGWPVDDAGEECKAPDGLIDEIMKKYPEVLQCVSV